MSYNILPGIFWTWDAWQYEQRKKVPVGCQLSFDFPRPDPYVRVESVDKDTGVIELTLAIPVKIISLKVTI